jgi:hypothetical protein
LSQRQSVTRRLRAALALAAALAVAVPTPLSARDFFLQENTEINLRLRTSVDTKVSQKGDRIITTVEDPVLIDNIEVIPVGARVYGRIGDIQKPGRFGKGGKLVIAFESIEVPGAGTVQISGSVVDLYDPNAIADEKDSLKDVSLGDEGQVQGGGPRKLKRIATIGAGAGAGAAAGGGSLGAAGIGVLAGVAVAYVVWKGKDVELPAGTGIVMRVDRGVTLSVPTMPRAAGSR